MRFSLSLLAALFFLTACAGLELPGLSESECRAANWADLGKRDGSMGMNWQIDQHAHRCARFGLKVDEPAYMAAWREAYSDWAMRSNPGAGAD